LTKHIGLFRLGFGHGQKTSGCSACRNSKAQQKPAWLILGEVLQVGKRNSCIAHGYSYPSFFQESRNIGLIMFDDIDGFL
jgi:hypothetical protein